MINKLAAVLSRTVRNFLLCQSFPNTYTKISGKYSPIVPTVYEILSVIWKKSLIAEAKLFCISKVYLRKRVNFIFLTAI